VNYLVCTANDDYNGWQLELLLESFKNLGLLSQVVIGLWGSGRTNVFRKLISCHNKLFYYESIGTELENRVAGVILATSQNQVNGEFFLLHADTIILSEPRVYREGTVFSRDPFSKNEIGCIVKLRNPSSEYLSAVLSLANIGNYAWRLPATGDIFIDSNLCTDVLDGKTNFIRYNKVYQGFCKKIYKNGLFPMELPGILGKVLSTYSL
jgi:hypothetical protein